MNAVSGIEPRIEPTTEPSGRMTNMLGIAVTPYFSARAGFMSISILQKTSFLPMALNSSVTNTSRSICLQGPHQVAMKSMKMFLFVRLATSLASSRSRNHLLAMRSW